ncbi:metal ABC transporter permease [Humidisolicoccus flavus]|uniref:metal ABC transporter permease n=1 Tax=Humidisolicoccus flavus TaxID=3111414 RepID=UPI003243CE90
MIEFFFEPFQLPFLARALLVMVTLSLAAATVGVLVNLRRFEFIGDGLTHTVFPGIVIGFLAGGTGGIMLGALVAAVLSAVVFTYVARRGTGSETGVAIILTSFFALGIVIVSTQSGAMGQLQEFFFGRLLTVTQTMVWQSIAVVAVSVVLALVTWRVQVFRAFDERGARASGIRTLSSDLTLTIAIALLVVAASAAIGTLLVLALLVVPAATARLVSARIGIIALVSGVFVALASWFGLSTSFWLSVSQGVNASPGRPWCSS